LIEYDISSTTTAESEDYSLLLADTTTMEQQDQIAAFGRLLIDDNEAVADYAWNGGQGLAKSVGDTEALVMSLATNSRMPKESWMAACDILYRISTAASVDDV
jgi:hypothetical protein